MDRGSTQNRWNMEIDGEVITNGQRINTEWMEHESGLRINGKWTED